MHERHIDGTHAEVVPFRAGRAAKLHDAPRAPRALHHGRLAVGVAEDRHGRAAIAPARIAARSAAGGGHVGFFRRHERERAEEMCGAERTRRRVAPQLDDRMLVTLRLQMEELLLVRTPARLAERRRQEAHLLVVKGGARLRAGEDDESAAVAQILFERGERRVGNIDHIGKHHGLEVRELLRFEVRRAHGFRLDEILRAHFRWHRGERVAEVEDLALTRFRAGIAIDEQHVYLRDRAHRDGPRVVGWRAIRRHARGDGVNARLAKCNEQRQLLRFARREGFERLLIRWRLRIDRETDRHVARFLDPEVAHLDLEAQRLADRRERAREPQARHRDVVLLRIPDDHHARLHILFRGAQHRRGLTERLPARRLSVGDDAYLLHRRALPLQHIERALNRRLPLRAAIRARCIADGFSRERKIARRLRDARLHPIRHEPHRDGRSRRERIQNLLRRLLCLVEPRHRAIRLRHARRVIEQEDRRHIAAPESRKPAALECRPRERQREQCE